MGATPPLPQEAAAAEAPSWVRTESLDAFTAEEIAVIDRLAPACCEEIPNEGRFDLDYGKLVRELENGGVPTEGRIVQLAKACPTHIRHFECPPMVSGDIYDLVAGISHTQVSSLGIHLSATAKAVDFRPLTNLERRPGAEPFLIVLHGGDADKDLTMELPTHMQFRIESGQTRKLLLQRSGEKLAMTYWVDEQTPCFFPPLPQADCRCVTQ